jgi:hypothetical protein
MPNRLLRDGITTSDRINALSAEAEITFYRLIVVCYDFWRMDARLPILKAQCFPLRTSATETRIEQWLTELDTHGLVVRYTNDSKPLLAVNKWEQRQRSRPKYAGPTDDGSTSIDRQLSDNCQSYDGLGKGKGKGKGATSRTGRELRSLPENWIPTEQTVTKLSSELNLKVPEDVDRYVSAFSDQCRAKGYTYKDFDAAFCNCVRQDWPKFRANGQLFGKSRGLAI